MDKDFEFALRLQSELNDGHESGNHLENQNSQEDLDLDLSFRLQAEYDAEVNDDSEEECLIVSDNLASIKAKQEKLTNSEDADFALALQLQSEWENGYTHKNHVSPEKKKTAHSVDRDLALAQRLQKEWSNQERQSSSSHVSPDAKKKLHSSSSLSVVDASWELVDPCPDIYALFIDFNKTYFWGKLEGVEVRWSPRMTLCAGVCVYEGRGRLCSVRLSKPLLKLRPRKDLVETLLHEMIHAYLFVTANNKDHDGHGPEFHKHMYRINKQSGTNISVYHSFHEEVALYKTHWWRCNGVCRSRKPYYGYVKRAMNRAPSPRDPWWQYHQETCGGTFIKERSPEPTKAQNTGKRKVKDDIKENSNSKLVNGMQDIRTLFTPEAKKIKSGGVIEPVKGKPVHGLANIHSLFTQPNGNGSSSNNTKTPLFSGKGFVLGSR